VFLAAVILTGWILGIRQVSSLGLPCKPEGLVSALCFGLAGTGLVIRGSGSGRRAPAVVWAGALAIVALVILADLTGFPWAAAGPAALLRDIAEHQATLQAADAHVRSSVNATVPFLLAALALVGLGRPRRSSFDLTSWCGIAIVSFALHILFSYPLVSAVGVNGQISPITAAHLAALGVAVALTRLEPDHVSIFRRGNPVGFVSLALYFAGLVMPPFLLAVQAWLLGRSGEELRGHTAFFATVLAMAFLGLLTVILRRMEVLDQNRGVAEQARSELLARLQQQAATLQFEVSERTFELKESSERLELALQSSQCGVWDWDAVGERAFWNERQCAIYGLAPGSFDGRHETWMSFIHPEDRARVDDQALRDLGSGDHFTSRYRIVTAAGTVRQIESMGFQRRDAAGKCVRIVGVDRDVTSEEDSRAALRSLAERLQFALGSAGYGVWEWDFASSRLAWDDRVLEIFGLRREDFLGHESDWLRALHPDDRPASTRAAARIHSGLSDVYEDRYRIIRPDGSVRHVEARGFLQRSPDGQPLRVIGLNRDITAERDLSERLRITEERWQLALAGSNDGLWDWNVRSNERYYDTRFLDMIGYEPGEIPFQFQEWEKRVHPDDLKNTQGAINAHFAGETPFYRCEYRLLHKQGHWVWILDRGKIVSRDAEGRPLRVVGTHTDISVSKALEGRLSDFEQMALQMGRLAQIGPWDWQVDAGKLTWSPEVHRLHHTDLGFEPTLDGMLQFYPPSARERLGEAIDEAVKHGTPFDLELPMVTAQGEHRWVRILGMAETKSGATARIHGAVQNITDLRESENARRRLETQLFQAQKMETLGTLAGGIAHDFNNLLTGILGYQELALDGLAEDHPARSCLDAARGVSMRARELVEQILTLSRRPTNEMATVDLAYVIEEARRFLRTTIPANIAIETSITPGCGPALAEATQIHQVLLNLGQNAAHAIGSAGGAVKISLSHTELSAAQVDALGLAEAGPYLKLSVADNGHGMDPETQKRIFDPFFTTKGVGQGTGLGLSVVHGIVRAHHGAIAVESELGKGATFTIYLRCAEAPEEASLSDDGKLPRGSGELVCVVDDEDFVLTCVSKAVDKLGYRTRAFGSPEKCLEAIRSNPAECALLVTDQTMPGMMGTELAERTRSFAPDLPIIIMSGYFSKISPVVLERMARVSLVSKPFTAHELAKAVHRALHPGT
jgi:PAS domain S-box-containing protein